MLKIGEFAHYARVSIRMLRYYDEQGLLKPVMIDDSTGYRYYAVDQLTQLNRIKVLRDVGFGVRDIRRLLSLNEQSLLHELRVHEQQLAKESEVLRRREEALDELAYAVEQGNHALHFEVEVKSIPAYDVVSLSMCLNEYAEERRAWERLGALMHAYNIVPSDPYTEYCQFPDGSEGGEGVVVEVVVATDMRHCESGELSFYRSEALPLAASVMVYGPYERISEAYLSFARWIEGHSSLRSVGDAREIAHRGCWNASDPSDYLTELLIPVERIEG